MIDQSVLGRHSRAFERIPSNQINGSDICMFIKYEHVHQIISWSPILNKKSYVQETLKINIFCYWLQ